MGESFVNIKFPFSDSPKGYFLDMNKLSADAIKSDLIHLLLTKKGDRLYLPEFGTNLLKYIFDQNDITTHDGIRGEVTDAISKFMPNLQVDDIVVEQIEEREHAARVRIDYTVTDDVFNQSDFVIIEL